MPISVFSRCDDKTAMAFQDSGAVGVIQDNLEARICVLIQTSVLHAKSRLQRSKMSISIPFVHHSGRIAAKPRVANTSMQAQAVLLKKMGVPINMPSSGSSLQEQFKMAFKGDMSA